MGKMGYVNVVTSTVIYVMSYIWAVNFRVVRQEKGIT